MAYPISGQDQAGVNDGLNYVLSGPGGLGQYFSGVSSYAPAYVTGFYRSPFALPTASTPNPPQWYVPPIPITGAGGIPADEKTIYFYINFDPQAAPPFATGQTMFIAGTREVHVSDPGGDSIEFTTPTTFTGLVPTTVTGIGSGAVLTIAFDPSAADTYYNLWYKNDVNTMLITTTTAGTGYEPGDIITIPGNQLGGTSPANDLTMKIADGFYNNAGPGDYQVPGAYSCSDSQVVIQTRGSYSYRYHPYISGGTVSVNVTNNTISTDCNARVTITGPTDTVFVNAQDLLTFAYTCTTTSDITIRTQISRFSGYENTSTAAVDYLFLPDGIIAQQDYPFNGLSGTGTVTIEPIFLSVIDQPSFGYFWYILEIQVIANAGDLKVMTVTENVRSLTAQVLKA